MLLHYRIASSRGMSGPVPRPRGRPRKDASTGGAAATTRALITTGLVPPFTTSHHHNIFHHPQQIHQHHHQQQQEHQQQEDEEEAEGQEHEAQDGPPRSMEDEEELLLHHQNQQNHHQQEQHQNHQQNQQQQQKSKKEIKRSWREEWKIQHRWVYPITKESGELRLKCQWCTAYNMDNVFAKEGCSTIQLSALNTHAKSEAHKTAETRWESSSSNDHHHHAGITNSLAVMPDGNNLWGFGAKAGSMEAETLESGAELNGDLNGNASASGRKRKFMPNNNNPTPGGGSSSCRETLASIMQRNNGRLVEILAEAESGKNKRHAVEMALLKKHQTVEEQRQRLDSERLNFERARLEATLQLGQQCNAALANVATALLKIGAALETGNNNTNTNSHKS